MHDEHRPKLFREMVGRKVRMRDDLLTRRGKLIPKGTVCTVYGTWRGLIHVENKEIGAHCRRLPPFHVEFLPKDN